MHRGITMAPVVTSLAVVAALLLPARTCVAAETVVAVRAEVTRVSDDLNWFNDSIKVGMAVEGTYNFFDAGFESSIFSPSNAFYEYHFRPNPLGFPVLPASMRLSVGGHDYATAPGAFFYGIEITNDPAGDRYHVQSPLAFPAHFNDFSGDPVLDPDGFFSPIPGVALNLTDSSGSAFSSTNLPLTVPDLASFDSAVGFLFLADGNGDADYAIAQFRITSLQVVPEPSAMLAIWVAVGVAAAARRRRPRR